MSLNITKERKRLENIKEQLEDLREKQREAEAEKKMLLRLLKDDFSCDTIEDAQTLLRELEKELEDMEKEIIKRRDKLIKEMQAEGLME